jgi:uncharacterized membrane protein
MTRPVAALVGPIVGSIVLSMTNYQTLFVVTGLLVGVMGVTAARKITDIVITQ